MRRLVVLLLVAAGCVDRNPAFDPCNPFDREKNAAICRAVLVEGDAWIGLPDRGGAAGDALPPPPDMAGDMAGTDLRNACVGRGHVPWSGQPCCPWAYERPYDATRTICCETRVTFDGQSISVCTAGRPAGSLCDPREPWQCRSDQCGADGACL